MDWVVLVMIGTSVMLGALIFNFDDGSSSSGDATGSGDTITRSDPGAGGYGPDGEHDLITGTSGPDLIEGGINSEVINANGGDDTILGGAGNDRIFGLGENDVINPGAGDDSVYGGDGMDAVDGGFLSGTFGDPAALIETLLDRLDAGFALSAEEYAAARALGLVDVEDDLDNDFIRGEDGSDILSDALGANVFHGDLGRDVIISVDKGDLAPDLADRQDTVFGGAGNDVIFADDGDIVSGGGAVDTFVVMRELNEVADDAFVTLTDFDPATETLEITDLEAELASHDLTYLNDAGGVYVLVGGTQVAYLEALTAADLVGANIFVTTAL